MRFFFTRITGMDFRCLFQIGCVLVFTGFVFSAAKANPEFESPETVSTFKTSLNERVLELLENTNVSQNQFERKRHAALIEFYSNDTGPVWVDRFGLTSKGEAAVEALIRADIFGLNGRDYVLPVNRSEDLNELETIAEIELRISQSVLQYLSDARGGRLNPKSLSKNLDYKLDLGNGHEDLLSLQHMPANFITAWIEDAHPKHEGFLQLKERLSALQKNKAHQKDIIQTLVNMERWRYLPRDLDNRAGIYVYNNIPEFKTRIFKNDKLFFEERMIVGKIGNQTPVFSDEMEWIEIHPEWILPYSIKKKMADELYRGERRGLYRFECPRKWAKNIKHCNVIQPAGPSNVLGQFKFKFPNMHHVYMHDTNSRHLFRSKNRLYSHGCLRVSQPQRIAEILLEHDKGMTAPQVSKILKGPRRVHKEVLGRKIPVHVTYFTLVKDKKGKIVKVPDYYGHDRTMAQALFKKGYLFPAPVIPKLVKNDLYDSPFTTGSISKHKRSKPAWVSALEGF